MFKSEEQCCKPGAAFDQGCSEPVGPDCFVVDSYWPLRTCKRDNSKCYQGWGVYKTIEACCEPGAAHEKGCSDDGPEVTVPSAPSDSPEEPQDGSP